MGNLTRDMEIRQTPAASSVGNFALAINRKWRSANGEQKEEAVYIECEAWGKTAEIMSQHLQKGDPLYVEGRLKMDTWEDKEGRKQSKMRVVVESFQFLASKPSEREPQQSGYRGNQRGSGFQQRTNQAPPPDIDVPF